MSKTIELQNFGSGWRPSDDPFNGDHNGLSVMDNLELDQNGALSVTSGTNLIYTLTAGDSAHTLFTFYYSGTLYTFIASTAGHVIVIVGSAITTLSSGGSTSIAAFALAFSYVLIASGNYRKKYMINGTTYNLGITPPSAAPSATLGNADYTTLISPTTYNVENNDTVTPSSSAIVTADISPFTVADGWENLGPGAIPIGGSVTNYTSSLPTGFTSALQVNINSGQPVFADFDLQTTIGARDLSIPGSSNPLTDTFTLYIRQDHQYFNTGGTIIVGFTDGIGAMNYGFNTTTLSNVNAWITLTCVRGDFSGSAMDWTAITGISIFADVVGSAIPGAPTSLNIFFCGGSFSTVVTTPGTPATIGTATSMTAICTQNSVIFESQLLSTPIDWGNLIGGGTQQDSDTFNLVVSINSGSISNISSINLVVLLTNPGVNFINGTDYYEFVWTNNGATVTPYTIPISRADFSRVGNSSAAWESVYGIMVTVTVNASVSFAINGFIPNTTIVPTKYFGFYGGSKALNGTFKYVEMFVRSDGSYLGKSVLGPVSGNIVVSNGTVNITPQDPTSIDPQVNQVWIFRRGTNMDQWYRVLVFNTSTGFTTPQNDNLSSVDAETLNITVNLNLISIASNSVVSPILDIIGPMEGRWFYFTQEFAYPSDILDPDLVDASLSVRVTNGPLEIYMWARKVSDGTIYVGTSKDIYVLSGTYQTLPDNSIDVYYRPLSVNYPPICPDAFLYEFAIYYMSASGWRNINGLGGNSSLTSPVLDKLFSGQTAFTYNPPNLPAAITSGQRFPLAICSNRMWCSNNTATGAAVILVWDFVRNYWRPYNLASIDGNNIQITAAYVTSDGNPIFAFNNGKVRKLNVYSNTAHLVDNVSDMTCSLQTLKYPVGLTTNRKDYYTVKGRTSPSLSFTLIFNTDEVTISLTVTSDASGLFIADFDQVCTGKFFYIHIDAPSQSGFVLSNIIVVYDDHPELVTSYKIFPTNFGLPNKKRVRVWPFVIDTQGAAVQFIPEVDGVIMTAIAQTFITTGPTTVFFFFTVDVFGIDYGMLIGGITGTVPTQPFEIWDIGKPDIVETLPIARRYWQAGPQEFFRYGQIDLLSFRLLAYGTAIPYKILINDVISTTGTLTTVDGVEASYEQPLPKGTSGQVLRIELGPTTFDFHVYYVHLRAYQAGVGTEKGWQVLPPQE